MISHSRIYFFNIIILLYKQARKIERKFETTAHDFIDEYNWYNVQTSREDDVVQIWRRVSSFIITDESGNFITPADLIPGLRGVYILWGYLLPSPGSERTSFLMQVKVTNYCIDFGFFKDDPSRGFWVYDEQQGGSQQTYYKLELPASIYKTYAAFDFYRMEHYLTLCNVLFFSNNFIDEDKKEREVVGYCNKSLEGLYAHEKKKVDSGQGGILIDVDVIKENSEFMVNLLSPILNKKNSKDFFNSFNSSNSLKRKVRDESDGDGKNSKYKQGNDSYSSWYVTVLNANANCDNTQMQSSMHSMITYSPNEGGNNNSNSSNNSNSNNRSNTGESNISVNNASNIGSNDTDENIIRSSSVASSNNTKSTKDIIGSGKVNSSKSSSKKVSPKTKKAGSAAFIMEDDEEDTRQPIDIGTTKLDDEQRARISTFGIKNLQGLVDHTTLASLQAAGISSSSDKKVTRVGSKSDNESGKETVMLKRQNSNVKKIVRWPDRIENKDGKYGELVVEYEQE